MAHPFIPQAELFPHAGIRLGVIVDDAAQESVELRDGLIQAFAVSTPGDMPDLFLEFLRCFLAHHHRIGFERKSEEIEMLIKRSDFGFLFAESESEFRQDGSHQGERLLCVREGAAEDDKVICIPHEIEAGLFERPIEPIEHDICQQRRDDSANTKDNLAFFRRLVILVPVSSA